MSTHALFTITLTNPDSMEKYREIAGTALAKHGGEVLQASGSVTVLDGDEPTPSIAAILRFPDAAAAIAWHSDSTLTEAHNLRRSAGKTSLMLME